MVAWDVQILDTDFKSTYNVITNTTNVSEKPIVIGKNNWLCFGSKILKGSVTPDYCIISAGTIINKDYSDIGELAILSMNDTVSVIAKGIRVNVI
jgi:acetyltransferase-like isoleucine patch superfamily enzyme